MALVRGEARIRLHGDWTLDVREEGPRHVVILENDETWEVADRLAFHVCATRDIEVRPGVRVPAQTRLYLRNVGDEDLTVALSPAVADAPFRIPRSAASVEACVAEPLVPEAQAPDAEERYGIHIPSGTPIVSDGIGTLRRHAWAIEAGDQRWWLIDLGRDPIGDPAPSPTMSRGTLSRDEIRSVIRAKSDEYRTCYERRLRAVPGLAGRVLARWVIGPTGSVEDVRIEGGPGSLDLPLEACIAHIVSRLQFPPPRGRGVVIVSYPFVFVESDPSEAPSEPPTGENATPPD